MDKDHCVTKRPYGQTLFRECKGVLRRRIPMVQTTQNCVTKRHCGQKSPMDKIIEDEERAFLYDPTT